MDFVDFFKANQWQIVRDSFSPGTPPEFTPISELPLSLLARRMLAHYPHGLYRHQSKAIRACLEGQHVCMTTATASGKSLVFYVCGVELLQRKPNGAVLAIYPLKALTDEQEMKWRESLEQTGVSIVVGRIDGSVPMQKRKRIIAESSVVIMTPDVIHAWLLSNLTEGAVTNFLANLQLIVIDEAHTYTGVFGSNASYLFRRLHHAAAKLGANPCYIAASATMRDPQRHLRQLVGVDFHVIERHEDSSGYKARRLLVVEPPETGDMLTEMTNLMHFAVRHTSHQFITFVDSRKQTEHLASVMRRGNEVEADDHEFDLDHLEKLHVCPFRAGYEAEDRRRIQTRLRQGLVRGVISTSALEMGVDIPGLTLGILLGIPHSATSYYQRIGRVGRHADGTIIVVSDGSILSNRIVRNPELLDSMPLAESTLYLENQRVQYIHAMCLARPGGEDESLAAGDADAGLTLYADFPPTFVALCQQERVGEVGQEFQPMKLEAGNNPNYAFPLRDCEVQYRVETIARFGPTRQLGSLSFSQVMREAYPGAVYYYQTQPFRVVRVLFRQHIILVRPERRYTTKPIAIPTLIFPNLSPCNVYGVQRYGELRLAESNLQLRESIIGFKERRGPNEITVHYPLDISLGLYFDQARFERNYFSSGVLFAHPVLEGNIQRELLAQILFEAFMLQVPFERQDLYYGSDRFRVSRGAFSEGHHFLCIYDQTYGSLRLTSRLMEPEIVRGVLDKALDIAKYDGAFPVDTDTLAALRTLREAVSAEPVPEELNMEPELPPDNCALVIVPGSVGLYPDYHNEEFRIDDVLYTPRGLVYRGKRFSQLSARFEDVTVTVMVDRILPIPGRSELGWYDFDTGEIHKDSAAISHATANR